MKGCERALLCSGGTRLVPAARKGERGAHGEREWLQGRLLEGPTFRLEEARERQKNLENPRRSAETQDPQPVVPREIVMAAYLLDGAWILDGAILHPASELASDFDPHG